MDNEDGGDGLERLLEVVRAERDAGEANRVLSPPVTEALVEAGLFRLGVPPSLGGPAPTPQHILDLLETLSAADVSAAWLVWNNLLPALLGRQLAPEVRAGLFGDRRHVFGNSTRSQGRAVPVAGGYRVSGRWALVSGCPIATHVMVLCAVQPDEAERTAPAAGTSGTLARAGARFVYVPASEITIADTWSTSGMRATASHDVVIDDVLVDAAHTCSYVGPASSAEGRLDQLPIMALMAAGAASMLIALAQLCVAELTVMAGRSPVTGGRAQAATRPALAAGLARGAAATNAARLAVRAALAQLWAATLEGDPAAPSLHGELYEAVDLARHQAMGAIRALHELGGTASVYHGGALERANRDALVMAQHVIFDGQWAEQAGRVRLGLAPTHPLFGR